MNAIPIPNDAPHDGAHDPGGEVADILSAVAQFGSHIHRIKHEMDQSPRFPRVITVCRREMIVRGPREAGGLRLRTLAKIAKYTRCRGCFPLPKS